MELLVRLYVYVQTILRPEQNMCVMHDLPSFIGCEKPPTIGGYRPDLYAADAPTNLVVIGEAKTSRDLETPHSRDQLEAYARHLALYPGSTFILSVPWQLRVRAHNLMLNALRLCDARNISTVVIDNMQVMPS